MLELNRHRAEEGSDHDRGCTKVDATRYVLALKSQTGELLSTTYYLKKQKRQATELSGLRLNAPNGHRIMLLTFCVPPCPHMLQHNWTVVSQLQVARYCFGTFSFVSR